MLRPDEQAALDRYLAGGGRVTKLPRQVHWSAGLCMAPRRHAGKGVHGKFVRGRRTMRDSASLPDIENLPGASDVS